MAPDGLKGTAVFTYAGELRIGGQTVQQADNKLVLGVFQPALK